MLPQGSVSLPYSLPCTYPRLRDERPSTADVITKSGVECSMGKTSPRGDHIIESNLKAARHPGGNLMQSEKLGPVLIVGAGAGLGASLARAFAAEGARVALAARNIAKLSDLCLETGAIAFVCDASSKDDVAGLFSKVDAQLGTPGVVIYNAGARVRGATTSLAPDDVERALRVGALGGFLVAQQAAERMLSSGAGAILFTGASASLKGYPQSAPFAMAKFALRGLAQSLARELGPLGVHVAHFVIDGSIAKAGEGDETRLDPDAIAQTYLYIARQPSSAWTWEVELRPSTEKF
jgi:NADP-dependent 3-hydroxy acid dehydrogenase YdfG